MILIVAVCPGRITMETGLAVTWKSVTLAITDVARETPPPVPVTLTV